MSTIVFYQADNIVDLEYNCLVPEIGATIYLRKWGDVKWKVLDITFVRNHVEIDVDWMK